jgi:hypothetical protein
MKARLQASMEEQASLAERTQLLEDERAKLEGQLASVRLDQLQSAPLMESQLKANEQEIMVLKGIEKELRAASEEVCYFQICADSRKSSTCIYVAGKWTYSSFESGE